MGVQGLWQVLEPTGKPVDIHSLRGKIFAIDVSIWLHQALKGYRDKDGNSLPNAHLLGVFYRVCKLLNYGIKPVFVFDGSVPVLKRQTISIRKTRKIEATDKSDVARQKLLSNLLRQHLQRQTKQALPPTLRMEETISKLASPSKNKFTSPDKPSSSLNNDDLAKDLEGFLQNFLSNIQDDKKIKKTYSSADSDGSDSPDYDEGYGRDYSENFSSIMSDNFDALPLETQHEILFEMQESKKNNSWGKIHQMPKDLRDFSSFQMDRLVKRRTLQKKIQTVQKEMGQRHIHVQNLDDLLKLGYNYDTNSQEVIAPQEGGYVLVKSKVEEKKKVTSKGSQPEVYTVEDDETEVIADNKNEIANLNEDEQLALAIKLSQKIKLDQSKELKNENLSADIVENQFEKNSQSDDEQLALAIQMSEQDQFVQSTNSKVGNPSVGAVENQFDSKSESDDEQLALAIQLSQQDFYRKMDTEDAVVSSEDYQHKSDSRKCVTDADHTSFSNTEKLHKPRVEIDVPTTSRNRSNFTSEAKASPIKQTKTLGESMSQKMRDGTCSKFLGWVRFSEMVPSQKIEDSSSSSEEDFEDVSENTKPSLDNSAPLEKATVVEIDISKISKSYSPEDDIFADVFRKDTQAITNYMDCSDDEKSNTYTNQDIVGVANTEDVTETVSDSEHGSDDEKSNTYTNQDIVGVANTEDVTETVSDSYRGSDFEKSNTHNQEIVPIANTDDVIEAVSDSDHGNDVYDASRDEMELELSTETESLEHADAMSLQSINKATSEKGVSETQLSPKPSSSNQKISRTLGVLPNNPSMNSADYLMAQQKLNTEQNKLKQTKGFQERIATSITDQMHIEAQELLTVFGIPYLVSPMEAESQCAFLDTACLTDGTITDDSDIWLFGGRRVYKNFFSQGRKHVEFFQYADIVQKLSLDREKLVLIAMLTGSDYTEGIEGVGPVTALEILSEFYSADTEALQSLVKFREWWEGARSATTKQKAENKVREKFRKLKIRPGFPNKAVYDAYIEPTVDESTETFKWGTPDLDAIRLFTKSKFGWDQSKCDATLLPVIKNLKCQASEINRQMTLDNFVIFGGTTVSGKRKQKSKRLVKAVKKIKMSVASKELNLSSDSDIETIDDFVLPATGGRSKIIKTSIILPELSESEKPTSSKAKSKQHNKIINPVSSSKQQNIPQKVQNETIKKANKLKAIELLKSKGATHK